MKSLGNFIKLAYLTVLKLQMDISPPLPSSLLSSPFPPTFSVRMQPCSTITAGSRHLDKVAIDLC